VVLGGILGTLAALALLALGLVYALRALRSRLRGAWRYGLANVSRRAGSSVAQVSALGLGLMAILLLTLVRTDLLARWQAELPADAPNRFVINVQPEQVAPVRDFLAAAGVRSPELWPVVRGRLVAVNGEAVTGGSYAARGGRAQRLAEREFNLSQAAGFGPDNTLIEGRWFAGGATGPEISVEVDFAEELGWKIGDRVRFDIAGRPWEATIGSLRKVDWESFRPNFFVVGSPGSLDGYPMSHITSVHVPATRGNAANELVLRFPNLSVIDIDAVLNQVRSTADQVSKAVEYVFYFTLAAGLLVLVAAVTATQDERLLEGGVMRVLGANRTPDRGTLLGPGHVPPRCRPLSGHRRGPRGPDRATGQREILERPLPAQAQDAGRPLEQSLSLRHARPARQVRHLQPGRRQRRGRRGRGPGREELGLNRQAPLTSANHHARGELPPGNVPRRLRQIAMRGAAS